MFNNILVPLDGSSTAEHVLDRVETLAALSGAEVMLLRVVPASFFPAEHLREGERPESEVAEEYLKYVAERLGRSRTRVSIHVRFGHPVEEIIEHGAKYADLIVLASHGRSGIANWALGGVADKVVRHSRIPTLLFPIAVPARKA